MYSLVIKIASLVNKTALDGITKPALGFSIANILGFIVETPRHKNSVIINSIFFLFKLLYFFLKYSLSILRDFERFS